MQSKQLSIIIPVLNDTAALCGLIKQVQAAKAGHIEIVVVDGGSDISPCASIPEDADVICITSEKGRANQMNAGADKATGHWLWFLHADSTVDITAALGQILSLPESRIWGRFDVRLSAKDWRLRIVAFMMNWRSRLTGIATGDQGIFVRCEIFKQVGGFPQIPIMEDVALSSMLKKCSRPFCSRQLITTSSRRWETNGVFKTMLLMWALRAAYAMGVSTQRLVEFYKPCNPSTQH